MNGRLSKIFKTLYKAKFYFNIPVSQVSFITGKIPELMGVLWLLEYFGISIDKSMVPLAIVIIAMSLVVFGKIWKKTGMYDIEQYVNAKKNEVQAKQLKAAELIIQKYGNKT